MAALFLIGWCAIRGIRLFERDGSLTHGIAIGLLFTGEFVFLYWGLAFTTASHSVIFLYTAPFFVALGAHLFLPDEPLRPGKVAGLVLAFAGLWLAVFDSFTFPSRRELLGDFMELIAAFLYQGVLVAFVSYLMWFWLLANYPASNLAAFSFWTPIFGVLAGGLLLGERITPLLWGAVALVSAGIFLVNRPPQ